jgi:nascent polypeptide-associated complex subunit alpha
VLGGIDPKQMNALMKKMGIKTEDIDAEEVVIKGKKTIVIKEPHVTAIDMQGQKTFQITGRIEEAEEKSSEDLELVMAQTGATKEEAEKALEESGGDIAEAILKLKKG